MKKQIDLQDSLLKKIITIKKYLSGQIDMSNRLNHPFNRTRLQGIENELNNLSMDISQFSQNHTLQTTYNTCLQLIQQIKQQKIVAKPKNQTSNNLTIGATTAPTTTPKTTPTTTPKTTPTTTPKTTKTAKTTPVQENATPVHIQAPQTIAQTVKKTIPSQTTTTSTQTVKRNKTTAPAPKKIYKTVTLNYPSGSKLTINQLSPLTPSVNSIIYKNDYIIANTKESHSLSTYEIIREAKQRNGEIFIFTDIVYGYIDLDKLQLAITTETPGYELTEYCRCVNEKLLSHSHIQESIKNCYSNIGELIPNFLESYALSNSGNSEFEIAIYKHKQKKHGITLKIKNELTTETIDIIPFGKIDRKQNANSPIDSSMHSYLILFYNEDVDTNVVTARPYCTKVIYGELDLDLLKILSSCSNIPSEQLESEKKYALSVFKTLQTAKHLDYIGHSITNAYGTKLSLLSVFANRFNYKDKDKIKSYNIDIPL